MPNSRRLVRAVPLALLSLSAACGSGGGDAGLPAATIQAWSGSVAPAEGAAKLVRNPDQPLLPDGSVRVDSAWRVEKAEGWAAPSALALSDENVFLLDARAGRIHVVRRKGDVQPSVGEGAGLSEPVSIAWSDGVLAVGDPGRSGIVMLRENGLALEPVRGLERAAVQGMAGGGFIANPYEGGTHQWQQYGRPQGKMVELPQFAGAATYCASVSGGPYILQADCAAPTFRVFDERGTLIRQVQIDRPLPPAAAAPTTLADADSAARKQLQAEAAKIVRGIRYDPASKLFALWGQQQGGSAWVDVFSEDGVYLTTVRFGAAWADFAFAGSTFYALEPGADGAAALAAYRLRLPANAAEEARKAANEKGNG